MSLGLQLQPERAYLRHRSSVAIRELPGFVRGRHRLPTAPGRAAEQFVHALAEPLLAAEIREIYERAKRVLGLRRRDLMHAVAGGGGNVEAPQFQFALELGVDIRDPSVATWLRRVVMLVGARELPSDFDELFPVACDELVVPFVAPASGGFEQIVDRLEDFAEVHGGEVRETQTTACASLATRDGGILAFDLNAAELSLRFIGVSGCRAVLLEAQRRYAELAP